MPRKPGKVPSYCLHKHSGQAVVRIGGRDKYLGKYGSPESYEQYERIIVEWRTHSIQSSGNRVEAPTRNGLASLTVNGLILSYWEFAKTYYVKDGQPTKELACMKEALRPLRRLYGHANAREFGPKALKAIRQHMVDQGLSRGVVNHRVSRMKRAFKWAVAEELIPPSVHQGLQAVAGLRYGRTEARETEPIQPVPDEWVDAVLPYVSPQIVAMIELQRFTGMRPCELVIMRACDILRTDGVWIYEPEDHKNRWRGQERKILLGPKAQQILEPFLDRDPKAYLFSPREADAWWRDQRGKQRRTPMTPSQARRKPKAKPKRPKRDRYDPRTYRQAIIYGINKANKAAGENGKISHWFPLQIRHSRGTEIRRQYGLDGAQVALGHARANVTEVYAEKNLELAKRIAREMG